LLSIHPVQRQNLNHSNIFPSFSGFKLFSCSLLCLVP
jgi:hypothetical protein